MLSNLTQYSIPMCDTVTCWISLPPPPPLPPSLHPSILLPLISIVIVLYLWLSSCRFEDEEPEISSKRPATAEGTKTLSDDWLGLGSSASSQKRPLGLASTIDFSGNIDDDDDWLNMASGSSRWLPLSIASSQYMHIDMDTALLLKIVSLQWENLECRIYHLIWTWSTSVRKIMEQWQFWL